MFTTDKKQGYVIISFSETFKKIWRKYITLKQRFDEFTSYFAKLWCKPVIGDVFPS